MSRFINSKLREADKDLFISNYSKHCPATDKKMPVVISKIEKDRIDKTNPKSYSGFIKTGSTEELKNKNYYICPSVWCPISRVSLSFEDLAKNNGKCPKPYEETPISLHKDGIVKKPGEYYKYPYFMNKNLHPNDQEMICCGYKLKKSDVTFYENAETEILRSDNSKHERYIKRSSSIPLEANRLSTLPIELHNILNPDKQHDECSGLKNDNKIGCFIRKGLNDNKRQTILQALCKTIDMASIKTVKSFIQHINDNLKMIDYVFLNNGNTMKTFMRYDEGLFEKFRTHFISDTDYINQMNLSDARAYLIDNNELIGTSSYIEQIVKREFLIYCSMDNFKRYMEDDLVVKEIDDILDLMRCESINPLHVQYIIIDITNENELQMLCHKYSSRQFEMSHPVVVLLKNNGYFEQLVRYNNETEMRKPFCGNDVSLSTIIDIFKKNCKQESVLNKVIDNVVEIYKTIELVINYNIKLVGIYDTKSRIYISLPKQYNVDELMKTYKVRYIDALHNPVSKIHKELENLDDHFKKIQPIPDPIIELDHLKIFIRYEELDARQKKMKTYIIEQIEYNNHLKSIINYKLTAFIKRVFLIRHPLNPLSITHKHEDMETLLNNHFPNVSYNKEAATDLYTKGLKVIENTLYENPTINTNIEYMFDKMDILEDTVLLAYDKSNNPYKQVDTSSEDLIQFVDSKNPKMINEIPKRLKIKLEQITLKPKTLYTKFYIDKYTKAVKSSIKDMYHYLLDKNDFPIENLKIYDRIEKLYNHKQQHIHNDHVEFWLNMYENNSLNKNQFTIENSDDLKDLWKSPKYKWGMIEIVNLAKIMDTGVLLLTKTKNNPNKYQLTVKNNVKVIIPHSKTYLMVYLEHSTIELYIVIKAHANIVSFLHDTNTLTNALQTILRIRKKSTEPDEPEIKFLREVYKDI